MTSGEIAHGRRPRVKNRWGEGDRLRADLIAAAARILNELGSEEGLTLRAVAAEVGIAPPSMYRHFAGKDELVLAVIQEEERLLERTLAEANADLGELEPLELVRTRLHAYCRFAMENPVHYRLMFGVRHTVTTVDVLPRSSNTVVVESFYSALVRCEEVGYTLRLETRRAAQALFFAATGRVAIWHTNPGRSPDATVFSFVDEMLSLMVDPRAVSGGQRQTRERPPDHASDR